MTIKDHLDLRGRTLDHGSFVIAKLLRGGLRDGWWSGIRARPTRRDVIITSVHLHYSNLLDSWLRYEACGIAPLLFVGAPDGQAAPKQKTNLGARVCVVEARPRGDSLADSAPLSPAESVTLGIGLCETIQSWAATGMITRGLRPETVYVVGEAGQRQYSGATPRAHLLLSGDDSPFLGRPYDPPSGNNTAEIEIADELFTVALLLWFALLAEHAYDVPRTSIHDNTWNDVRRPFTGPPELGNILERVLVSDVEKRMKVDEMRDELLRLARAWNVDVAPFPPPGLEP